MGQLARFSRVENSRMLEKFDKSPVMTINPGILREFRIPKGALGKIGA